MPASVVSAGSCELGENITTGLMAASANESIRDDPVFMTQRIEGRLISAAVHTTKSNETLANRLLVRCTHT